jgi:HEAT repeat protein
VLAALANADGAVRLVAVSSIARFEAAEPELVRAASADEDIEVRRAALELLAAREGNAATVALLGLLEQEPGRLDVVAALAQGVEPRIPVLLAHLEKADDSLARALLAALSSVDSRQARASLDTAFGSRNPSARRAAARVFSLLLDDAARASLARSASMDSDPEVRRICALSLA